MPVPRRADAPSLTVPLSAWSVTEPPSLPRPPRAYSPALSDVATLPLVLVNIMPPASPLGPDTVMKSVAETSSAAVIVTWPPVPAVVPPRAVSRPVVAPPNLAVIVTSPPSPAVPPLAVTLRTVAAPASASTVKLPPSPLVPIARVVTLSRMTW